MTDFQPHKLFTTGELLYEVIRQIDSPKALARSAQVNREWHNYAIPLLWRGHHDQASPWRTPDLDILITLSKSANSFRYYVGFMDKLVLLHGRYQIDRVDDLFTPDLWSPFRGSMVLADLGSDCMSEKCMSVFIQPALRSLSLYGGYYSDAFLQRLKDTCPLQLLLVDNRSRDITPQALQRYIEHTPLQFLELEQGFEDVFDTSCFETALRSPTLQHFSVRSDQYNLQMLPFPVDDISLRSLHIGSYPMLGKLFSHTPNLESFTIDVVQASTGYLEREVLGPLTNCLKLRELTIDSNGVEAIDPDALVNFANKCRLINVFDIGGTSRDSIPVSNSHFITAISKWANLHFLEFQAPVTDLSSENLAAISKACPEIVTMIINCRIELSAFDSETVNFPRLQEFGFNELIIDCPQAQHLSYHDALPEFVERQLRRRMPNLRSESGTDFYLGNSNDIHYRSLGREIRRRILKAAHYQNRAPRPSTRRDIEDQISGG